MVTSSSSLSWFAPNAANAANAATLRSQVEMPNASKNTPVMSSNLELGVPNSNSQLMAFVNPSAKCSKNSVEKSREAGVGNKLNILG